ncbi:hypothetical protein GALL_459550 [mine drainage metagenome]|uniref:Uncharacterized protein n=1 Tax=mine drainage metagenome TaxID=410659 RepID=A0A1J5Q4L6_9ZZZZ
MHETTRRLQHAVDGFTQQTEVGGIVNQAGAAQQQVVKVTGEAFKKPQQFGVVFPGIVIVGELDRTQSLDVPGMKVLMADQTQQGGVAIRGRQGPGLADAWQVGPLADQRGAVAVFQSTVTVVLRIEHEQIMPVRWLVCAVRMPKPDFCLANGLRVGKQACPVKTGGRAVHHEAMFNATGIKATTPEGAPLHRGVHQFVVIGSLVLTKAPGGDVLRCQRRGNLPAGWQAISQQGQVVGTVLLTVHAQKQTGAIEEAALRVQPGGAHRIVKSVNLVTQCHRFSRRAMHLPGAFVALADGQTAAPLMCLEVLQIF